MRKNKRSTGLWSRRGRSAIPLLLAPMILALILSGCASKPPMQSVGCPQLPAVPATLKESSLPDAQAYSKEARSWFEEVSSFLSELR